MRLIPLVLLLLYGLPLWAADTDNGNSLIADQHVTVTFDALKQEISVLPDAQQNKIQSDRDALFDFLDGLYLDLRLEKYADASGFSRRPDVDAELKRARRLTLVGALIRDHLDREEADAPDFTPLAENYYKTHPEDYVQPAAIRAEHLLFQVAVEGPDASSEADVKSIAEAAMKSIEAGEAFDAVAERYAEKYEQAKFQEIPKWITKNSTVPPFDAAAFALQDIGDISGLVRTRFGFHIIRLVEKRDESTRPFERVKTAIIAKIRKKYTETKRQEFINSFYPDEKLSVNRELLDEWLDANLKASEERVPGDTE